MRLHPGDHQTSMKRIYNFHPYVFTLVSVLYVYLLAQVVSPYRQFLTVLLVLTAILGGLSFPVNHFIKNRYWSGVVLTALALSLFTPREIFYLVGGTLAVSAGVLFIILKILKKPFKIVYTALLFDILSLLFLALFLSGVFVESLYRPFNTVDWANYREQIADVQQPPAQPVSPSQNPLPDIYFIVLDAYGRNDVLQRYYAFDNHEITDFLTRRGFFVPEHSRSNYPKTVLSVPSMLNMQFTQEFTTSFADSPLWWVMKPLVDHNRVRTILESAGYQTIAIATDWQITNNTTADIYLSPKPFYIGGFSAFYVSYTPLRIFIPLLRQFAFFPTVEAHRDLTNYIFDTLADLPPTQSPKFIFAHAVVPHPPFVFDAQGNPVDPGYAFSFNDANDFPGSSKDYRTGYIEQVQFVNARLETTVDAILQNSTVPPVIIITADHGPGMFTDFTSAENTCLNERFSIFMALYLPGADPAAIPDDITSVNIFRIVLNTYLGTDLPLLPNQQYYMQPSSFYRLQDVTRQVDVPCPQR